jgi:hypothetical protein
MDDLRTPIRPHLFTNENYKIIQDYTRITRITRSVFLKGGNGQAEYG